MLTRKQHDLLNFIHKRLQKDGVPPSFDEMKDALDLRSKSGIHRLITALEERGFIFMTQGPHLGPSGIGRASVWGLAEEATPDGRPARKTFMRFHYPRTNTVHDRHKKEDAC